MKKGYRVLIRKPSDLQLEEKKKKTSNSSLISKIAISSVLMALGAVLKFFGIMITSNMRLSFFAIPLILSGLLNGLGFGLLTSLGADLLYSLISGYAFNPAFTISALYWGILGAVFSRIAKKKGNLSIFVIFLGVLLTSLLETHTNIIVTYILYGSGTTMLVLLTKYLVLIIKLPIIVGVIKLLYERLIKGMLKQKGEYQ